MIARRRESGMSLLGTLCVLFILGFFVMCFIRMAPPYFEYLTVKNIISKVAVETDPAVETITGIRRKIVNVFNSNQIYQLKPQDIEIYRSKGKTYIDGDYEVRLPLVWRIDAVLKFDDLLYQVGNPNPVPQTLEVKK